MAVRRVERGRARGTAFTDESRWVDVFYEELVAHPVDEMRRLYAELGLTFTPRSSGSRPHSPRTSRHVGDAAEADKWRERHDERSSGSFPSSRPPSGGSATDGLIFSSVRTRPHSSRAATTGATVLDLR